MDAALAAGIVPVHTVVDAERATPQLVRALEAGRLRGASRRRPTCSPGPRRSGITPASRRSSSAARCPCSILGRRGAVGVRLHGVADPGNVGTILRAADGLGPAHVVLGPQTADPLAPKAVRASMGALFRVPLVALDDAPPARTVALDARAEDALWDVELTTPIAFELGAERAGLPAARARGGRPARLDPARSGR